MNFNSYYIKVRGGKFRVKKKIIILCMIFLILFFPILIITMSNNQSLDVKFLEEKYGDNYDEIIIYLENKIKDKNISKKIKGQIYYLLFIILL